MTDEETRADLRCWREAGDVASLESVLADAANRLEDVIYAYKPEEDVAWAATWSDGADPLLPRGTGVVVGTSVNGEWLVKLDLLHPSWAGFKPEWPVVIVPPGQLRPLFPRLREQARDTDSFAAFVAEFPRSWGSGGRPRRQN